MPASRWNTDFLKLLSYLNNPDDQNDFIESLDELEEVNEGALINENNLDQDDQPTIQEISILPLRGVVAYPQTTIPLTIGQPRSIRLVDQAVSKERMIGMVASKNPELENPSGEDLFQVGTLASIHRLFRAPDGTIRLLVQGLSRFKILEFIATEPYLQARVELFPEVVDTGL